MILLKMAARSIWRGRKSYIACIILMAIGVMIYISFHMMYDNLLSAKSSMYHSQRFSDAFASVRRLPLGEMPKFFQINGISGAQAGIVMDSRVTSLGESDKIVTLRLNSFDPSDYGRQNDFIVRAGAIPAAGEILIGESFMNANGLEPGDAITVILGGKEVKLIVSGSALSPEYIFTIPDGGQLMPDDTAFGFAFIPYDYLASRCGMTGAANTVSFLFEDGYVFEDLRIQLEDALAPYGTGSLLPAKDQPSNAMLTQEIDSLGSMATGLSMVFVFMAVIILYIMLKRVIEKERSQIGTLKAFGYSNTAILGHYICYGLVAAIPGGALGVGFGLVMAKSFTSIYLDYFHMPGIDAPLGISYPAAGFAIAMAAGAAGAFMGARSILKLLPGEAMKPLAPPIVKKDILAHLPFLGFILSGNGKMAIRNISRSKMRASFVVAGVAFSFSLIAFMNSYDYLFDAMLLDQYTKVQLYDMKISLREPVPEMNAIEAVWAVETVKTAEGLMELPCEMSLGHLRKNVIITAMDANSELYRIHDNESGVNKKPPENGIILSEALAEKLEAKRGDLVAIKTPYTGNVKLTVAVVDVIKESLGMTAYMELGSLCGLLDAPRVVNSVMIKTSDAGYVKSELLEAKNVSALTDVAAAKKVYEDMFATYASMIWFMQAAAAGVAFAIIVNTAAISLNERAREYSTLRVVGMHPREIGRIIAFEYRLLSLVGAALGIPLTRMLKEWMSGAMNTELFTFPTETPVSCYITALVCCALTVELCNLMAVRGISRFDMVEVLKERE